MGHNEATFPLSPPSWTWGVAPTSASEASDDSDQKTKPRRRKSALCWNELPSRRWLIQASRKL